MNQTRNGLNLFSILVKFFVCWTIQIFTKCVFILFDLVGLSVTDTTAYLLNNAFIMFVIITKVNMTNVIFFLSIFFLFI